MKEQVLVCPVCGGARLRTERQYTCPAGHSFDVAKEGYVNLLCTSKSADKMGDSKESAAARHAFLERGYYGCLKEALTPLLRGNVLDMAVGVVIGGAFTAIVNSLVNDIINPAIGLFFNADFSDVVIQIGDVGIGIGSFLNAIINFLIVAFVLFVVLKAFIALFFKKIAEEEAPAEPTTKVCPYCQSEIAIKAVRCPPCTSKLEGYPEAKL